MSSNIFFINKLNQFRRGSETIRRRRTKKRRQSQVTWFKQSKNLSRLQIKRIRTWEKDRDFLLILNTGGANPTIFKYLSIVDIKFYFYDYNCHNYILVILIRADRTSVYQLLCYHNNGEKHIIVTIIIRICYFRERER